ncbi:hypothetical protein BH11CYA1_BH11CYA1_08070 [soil metagenome]
MSHSSKISWSQLTGRDLYLAIVCSPALRLERKQAYARDRAIAKGRLKVLTPRKLRPARSREIWHISLLLDTKLDVDSHDAVTYCLHPHTGQPLVVNGSCLVYDGESSHFRMVQYVNGKGSHFSKQPDIYDGEAHLACDGGTLVAIYRKGKCVSSSFVSSVTTSSSKLMAMIFGAPGGPDITRKNLQRKSGKSAI